MNPTEPGAKEAIWRLLAVLIEKEIISREQEVFVQDGFEEPLGKEQTTMNPIEHPLAKAENRDRIVCLRHPNDLVHHMTVVEAEHLIEQLRKAAEDARHMQRSSFERWWATLPDFGGDPIRCFVQQDWCAFKDHAKFVWDAAVKAAQGPDFVP